MGKEPEGYKLVNACALQVAQALSLSRAHERTGALFLLISSLALEGLCKHCLDSFRTFSKCCDQRLDEPR